MSPDIRTPAEILKFAKEAQAKADKVREMEIEKTLRERQVDRDTTRAGHASLKETKKNQGELAGIIEGVEKQGREVVPEMRQAESDLTKSEEETSGVIKGAEQSIASAEARPEIISRLYDEAEKEEGIRQWKKKDEEDEKRKKEASSEIKVLVEGLVKEYDFLVSEMLRKNDEQKQFRQQFEAEKKEKAHELYELSAGLRGSGVFSMERVDELMEKVTGFSSTHYSIRNHKDADYSLENLTETINVFKKAVEKVGFFEIKVKKYLKEILRWLEEYQPIAKARHEERDRSERDYVQFTEDNRRKQTYKINQISNKRQESWSLYVEAMKDDKNLRERLWTMGNQNGVDLRAT